MAEETCYHTRTKVVDVRDSSFEFIRRRRRLECLDCGLRFNTVEVMATHMKTVKDHELAQWLDNKIRGARAYARETDLSSTA